MTKKVFVRQQPEKEIPTEILAESIVAISDGFRKLRSGRLNDKTLLLLVSHASGVAQREIKAVFEAIESLERLYLKKKS